MGTEPEQKRGRGRPPVRGESSDARIEIRVKSAEKQQFEDAAQAAGIALSEWIRDALIRASKRGSK